MFSFRSITGVAAFLASSAIAFSAQALVVGYEWTEGGPGAGTLSPHVSRHGVRGPVVADDFVSVFSGRVARVEWWGSAPIPGPQDPDFWEITFHADAGGTPSTTFPGGVLSQHFVSTNGSDSDGDGVFQFTANWVPQDMFITAGTPLWFSVANAQCTQVGGPTGPACAAGWTWADAGGPAPTVGSQSFTAHDSFGIAPNGGPHFGPWNPLSSSPTAFAQQDLAFRILLEVPEPGSMAVFGIGLAGLTLMRRKKRA